MRKERLFKSLLAFLRLVNYTVYKFLKTIKILSNHSDSLFFGIILFHYSKFYSLSKTIYILLIKKRINEIDILLRSLLETYVNINFIATNPNLYSQLFLLDELYKYRDSRVRLLEHSKIEKELLKNQLTQVGKEIREALAKIGEIDKSKNYSEFKWETFSIEDKCEKLGLNVEYNIFYKSWNNLVHPSSYSAKNYIKSENDAVYFIDGSEYDDEMLPERILHLTEYLIDISYFVKKKYNIDNTKTILTDDSLKKMADYHNELSGQL